MHIHSILCGEDIIIMFSSNLGYFINESGNNKMNDGIIWHLSRKRSVIIRLD